MRKDDSFEKASSNAQKTMALLKDRHIKTIPQNFTIWYEYLSEENPEIMEVVNRLIAKEGKFSDAVAKQIYNEFFSHEKESQEIRETNRLVQKSMEAVLREIQNSANGLDKYGAKLEDFAGRADGLSAPDLQRTVQKIIAETHHMSEQSQHLNTSLKSASKEIFDLKQKLERVESEALTDPLTGIANRKKFDKELLNATARADTTEESLCLVMSDIDHFKRFNDRHGHVFGDQVLKLVAHTLSSSVDNMAIAARYGGEEFGIILPNSNLVKAARIANRLRENVSCKKLIKRNTGADVGRITMSFGVAQFNPGENINSFIARADSALYTAKNSGRDQVKVEIHEMACSV